jgi:hypothetical protein
MAVASSFAFGVIAGIALVLTRRGSRRSGEPGQPPGTWLLSSATTGPADHFGPVAEVIALEPLKRKSA